MRTSVGFRQKETTTIWLLFSFFCDEHFWCQVWRTLLLYFQRYSLFSILQFKLHNLWRHHFPNLHINRKTSISLKRKKIFQKGKCHYHRFGKACQISCRYFSFYRHLVLLKWPTINIYTWCEKSFTAYVS